MIDKKELKRQYKQNPPPMGIYQIRNLVNGKILIGNSKNLTGKSNSYKFQLNSGLHINSDLQKEYKQFGEENFVFEILDKLEPKDDPAYVYDDDLNTLEELWQEKLQPYDEKGYNKRKPAKISSDSKK
jgi:group I intron endonuclease